MQQELMSQYNSLNQTAYDATKQVMDLNARTVEKLMQQQISMFEMCLQGGTKQWELAQNSKDLAAYLKGQGELMKECSDKALAMTKQSWDVLGEARSELTALLEKGMTAATDSVKSATVKKAA